MADEKVTSLSSAGTVYWALTDHLGTVRDLVTYNAGTDTTTNVKHRAFDSFGNVVSDTNTSLVIGFGYTGKLWDTATGLQWNINRWYDPFLGQWISEDPIGFAGGDENLRRYVGNRTVDTVDPSGLESPVREHPPRVGVPEITDWHLGHSSKEVTGTGATFGRLIDNGDNGRTMNGMHSNEAVLA